MTTSEIVKVCHVRFEAQFDPDDDCQVTTVRVLDEHDNPVGPDLGEMFTSLNAYGEKTSLYDEISDAAWLQYQDRVVSERAERQYRHEAERSIA